MEQPEPERLQLAVGQLLVGLGQADRLGRFRFFDQRRDDESLPALAELVAEEIPPLRPLLVVGQIRVDFLPARRAVAERRNVEVAEQRHRDRSRDGRGGHHQVMRIGAGLLQRRPLTHAELVLLVDHHQPELGERHVLLDDRLRADHQIDLAGGDQLQQGGTLGGRQSAGKLGAADLAGGQHPVERQGVLPGEHFRGGHQRRLVSVGDRQQHGVDRHDRLAAAHVPLQQPVHRHRAGHVGRNLRDRLLLARRQLEREQPANPGVDLRRGLQRRRPPLVVLLLPPNGQAPTAR